MDLAASDRWTPTINDFHKDHHEGHWWLTGMGKCNKDCQVVANSTHPAFACRQITPLFPVHRGKGSLSNTTNIRNIVQVCFARTIDSLNAQGLKEEFETMMDSTVQWFRHTGTSEGVNIRPREHLRDDARNSSSAITDRYIDIELTERHKSDKRNRFDQIEAGYNTEE